MEEYPDFLRENVEKNTYTYYFILLAVITAFLVGQTLLEEYVTGSPGTFFEQMIPVSILYVFLLGYTLVWARRTQVSNNEMGFHSLYLTKSLAIGLLATSGYLIAVLAFQIPPTFTAGWQILLLFGFTLIIGLTEESAFRGYIQGNLMRKCSRVKAVLMTGILFALLHVPSYLISGNFLNLAAVPNLILVGIILGYIRVHTGNIWGVIIAHTTWNYYLFLFIPDISSASTLMELIPALVASGGMWGSIVLAMVVAKLAIDRPEQMPDELGNSYQMKIESLMKHIWKVQQRFPSTELIGLAQSHLANRYATRIAMEQQFIDVYKEYLPLINEKTYKIIRELVPNKLNLIKIENYIAMGGAPMRIHQLELRRSMLEQKVRDLEIELGTKSY